MYGRHQIQDHRTLRHPLHQQIRLAQGTEPHSWNDGEPKLDLRDRDPDHVKMGRGVTLTEEEAKELRSLLSKWEPRDRDS